MVQFVPALLIALSAITLQARGAPLHTKRIAQVIADSTALWEKACVSANILSHAARVAHKTRLQLAAGGAEQCNPVSVTAFTTLLAAAGPCDQQNSADAMVDLAKTLNSDADMIKFAQIFAQQPRNTVRSLLPYPRSRARALTLALVHPAAQLAGGALLPERAQERGARWALPVPVRRR